ncbi:MAG: prepilin peptidase [Chloroflexi bacterium]|nr:prepilin peptidase [Chloroflexota bacterium]
MVSATTFAAIVAFLVGASVGSFLNVVIDRVPAGKSLIRPRSFCDSCQKTLQDRDLVPIVSYLALRGHCRACGARIPLRVILVEILTAGLFAGLALAYGPHAEFIVLAAAAAYFIAIAGIDYDRQLILHSMTLPAMAVVLAISFFWPHMGLARTFLGHDGAWAAFVNSLLSGLASAAAFLAIYIATAGRGMGEGDITLAAVMGFLFGFPGIVLALWLGIVVGGVIAIGLLVLRKKSRKDAVPFGVFLAVGAIASTFLLHWITVRYQEMGLRAFTL